MLTTLIRLMGAWIAVYGLMFGAQFGYMLKIEPSGMHLFLAFLPSLASLIIGLVYIIFASRIAGGKDILPSSSLDILPSGLILLGVYWFGSGIFQGIGNFNFYNQIFDSARYDQFSNSASWVAVANLAQVLAGAALVIVGHRIRR